MKIDDCLQILSKVICVKSIVTSGIWLFFEKLYSCKYCDSKFSQPGSVKEYQKIHLGEKLNRIHCHYASDFVIKLEKTCNNTG